MQLAQDRLVYLCHFWDVADNVAVVIFPNDQFVCLNDVKMITVQKVIVFELCLVFFHLQKLLSFDLICEVGP